MTAKELANLLDGREYGSEITKEEIKIAKESGLVVVFGASDDLMEFCGAIDDEVDCFEGGYAYICENGIYKSPQKCDDCDVCEYVEAERDACNTISAIWCGNEFSWTYHTEIPHETFDILEDGGPYCRGIVFSLEELEPQEKYSAEDKSRYLNILCGTVTGSYLETADKKDLIDFITYLEEGK